MAINVGTAIGYLDLDTTKFQKGFSSAIQSLTTFTSKASGFSEKMTAMGGIMKNVGSGLTMGVTLPVVGLGTAIVKTGMDFETAMSQVQATMGTTKDKMGDLKAAAIEMGAKTAFSSTEAAEALNYLASAGYDSSQQIAALPKVLELAAAGAMPLADAADMLTGSMSSLGLASTDSTVLMKNMDTMVNQMAKTAAATNSSVTQLGEAIGNVGGTAKNLKGGTTELNTVLGILANNGTKGSEAGIRLRNIMLAMTPTTKVAKDAFEKLNVDAYDANGNFRALKDTFTDLNKAMEGMTQKEKMDILNQMFNATDLKDIQTLLATTTDQWDSLTAAISDSSGAAATMAATQLDNLSGQMDQLGGTVESIALQFNDVMVGALKNVVRSLQSAADWVSSLSEAQKKVVLIVAAVIAAIGPVLLIVGNLITMLGAIGPVLGAIGGALGAIAAPVLIAAAAIAALGAAVVYLYKTNDDFKKGVTTTWNELVSYMTEKVAQLKEVLLAVWAGMQPMIELLKESIAKMMETAGPAIMKLIEAFKNLWTQLEPIIALIAGVFGAFLVTNFAILVGVINGLVAAFTPLIDAITDAISFVSNFISMLAALLTGDFSGALEYLKAMLNDLASFVGNIFLAIWAFISGFASGFITTLTGIFGQFGVDITGFFTTIWAAIVGFFTGIGAAFTEFFTVTIPNFVNGFITWFNMLPYNIGYAIGLLIGSFNNLKARLLEFLIIDVPQFILGVVNWFATLPQRIFMWLLRTIANVIIWMNDMKVKAKEAGSSFVDSVIEFFATLPGKAFDWLMKTVLKLGEANSALRDAGKALMDSMWEGLKASWDQISDWFEGIANKVKDFFSGIEDGMNKTKSATSSVTKSTKVSGSHKNGLSYVPYDGYIAELHKGERVLTAEENASSGSGLQVVINSPTAVDPYTAAKIFKRTIKEIDEGF